MRDYADKSHQKAFWAEVQRVTTQLPESGRTVAAWLSQMVRELPLAEEAPTPELYAEAADFILARYAPFHFSTFPYQWTVYQHNKRWEQRRAKLAALPPVEFRIEWDGRSKDRAYPFWGAARRA